MTILRCLRHVCICCTCRRRSLTFLSILVSRARPSCKLNKSSSVDTGDDPPNVCVLAGCGVVGLGSCSASSSVLFLLVALKLQTSSSGLRRDPWPGRGPGNNGAEASCQGAGTSAGPASHRRAGCWQQQKSGPACRIWREGPASSGGWTHWPCHYIKRPGHRGTSHAGSHHPVSREPQGSILHVFWATLLSVPFGVQTFHAKV